MILTGPEIEKQVALGAIMIDPFDPAQVNPNSYNVRLSEVIATYDDHVLDSASENNVSIRKISGDGLLLTPEQIYLGATIETIGSDQYVPIVRARSSTARLGVFVHVTADLVDLGYIGQITLQLHAVQGARIYAGMEIGQVTFWKTQGERVLYRGKYQGSIGPAPSKSFLDWKDESARPHKGREI
jgi:dCTP deaminase